MNIYFYFSIFLLIFATKGGHGDETESSCNELSQKMQKLVAELKEEGPEAEEIFEKIKILSAQLEQNILYAKQQLLAPLIVDHAQKVGRMCEHLQRMLINEMAPKSTSSKMPTKITSSEVSLIRKNGIDQMTGRIEQLRRLMVTSLVEWQIWPLLINSAPSEGTSDDFAHFLDKFRQKIGIMIEQIEQDQSYYNISMFEEALNSIIELNMDPADDGDEFRKIGKIFAIVQKLMANASRDMLSNVMKDLVGPSSKFYGIKFLEIFSSIINFNENFCAEANAMFEQQKPAAIEQIKAISSKLRGQMRVHKIAIKSGTTKSHKLIASLKNVQNLFENVYNELVMIDLLDSAAIMGDKLQKLDNILKQYNTLLVDDGMPKNAANILPSEELLNCLDTDSLEKRIAEQADSLAILKLF